MTSKELALLNALRDEVSANAKKKGFRDQLVEGLSPEQVNGPIGQLVQAAVFTSNAHGEISEFWEAFRKGKLNEPCDKAEKMAALGLPALTCAEEELADILIRTLDTAEAFGVDIAKAVSAKAAFNATRPHLHGGKKA